jgi:hypothetical protein
MVSTPHDRRIWWAVWVIWINKQGKEGKPAAINGLPRRISDLKIKFTLTG